MRTEAPENRRASDLALLERILSPQNAPEVTPSERNAFRDMLGSMTFAVPPKNPQRELTTKQRKWASEVDDRLRPIDASKVPRGREVATPDVLRNLPKVPPTRMSR